MVVLASQHGQLLGERSLEEVEHIARARGACKLTLEVLGGNMAARRLDSRVGFAPRALDPSMRAADFLQKKLAP